MQDINDFIDIAEKESKNTYLVNGDGDFKVPIRSRLGAIAIANLHFDDLWVFRGCGKIHNRTWKKGAYGEHSCSYIG